MTKKYVLNLTAKERAELESIVGRGKTAAWQIQRAHALLKCDQSARGPGWTDRRIAEAYGCTTRSVENWRRQAVAEGALSLLRRKSSERDGAAKLDRKGTAQLLRLASSRPPNGQQRWTLRLLARRLVDLGIVESISYETVRRTLRKIS